MSYKKLEITDEEQDKLIQLYKDDYKKWRLTVSKMIKDNPETFNILSAGNKTNKNVPELTFDEFKEFFDILKEELIKLIFNDMDKNDGNKNNTVKITAINRWINNKTVYKQKKAIKDEEWLYNTLKSKTVKDFDANEDAKIQFDEFYNHLKKDNINKNVLRIVFDLIDTNKDGDISIREFIQWQNKKNAKKQLLNTIKRKNYTITDDTKTDYEVDLEEIKNRTPTNIPDVIYVKSGSGKWRECCVLDTKGTEWKIHYQGFKPEFDEWISYDSNRISYKKPDIVVPKNKKKPQNVKRVWVLSKTKKIWREAIVVENPKNDNLHWKIHYISYHNKYDEMVVWNGSRCKLTRPNGNKISIGDNFSCYNETFKAWLEAECIDVDDTKDTVKICYVGSSDKTEVLPKDSNRISLYHKNHNAPAPK